MIWSSYTRYLRNMLRVFSIDMLYHFGINKWVRSDYLLILLAIWQLDCHFNNESFWTPGLAWLTSCTMQNLVQCHHKFITIAVINKHTNRLKMDGHFTLLQDYVWWRLNRLLVYIHKKNWLRQYEYTIGHNSKILLTLIKKNKIIPGISLR